MGERPTGTITFLLSDIEGSTRLLRELCAEGYAAHDGREVDTQGDAFFVAFARPRDAVGAAADGQRANPRRRRLALAVTVHVPSNPLLQVLATRAC